MSFFICLCFFTCRRVPCPTLCLVSLPDACESTYTWQGCPCDIAVFNVRFDTWLFEMQLESSEMHVLAAVQSNGCFAEDLIWLRKELFDWNSPTAERHVVSIAKDSSSCHQFHFKFLGWATNAVHRDCLVNLKCIWRLLVLEVCSIRHRHFNTS